MNKREMLRLVGLLPMAGTAGLAALLTGCAAMNQFSAEVSTFGEWPAGRAPGSYAFDRMPSQVAQAEATSRLEEAARPALEHAGFVPVAAGAQPDVLVQLGARVDRAEFSPWDDPLWWHGGFGQWHRGPWRGPLWGGSVWYSSPRFDREAALLIRDRASGQPLFEARASSEGYQAGLGMVLQPLFAAALADFPNPGTNPRRITVPLQAE